MAIVLVVLVVIVVVVALLFVSIYNNLVTLRANREQAFADIDVQMKQRYDLVPNLVNTVKGYATHEKELLEKLTELRSVAMGAKGVDEKIAADNQFSSTLKTLFAVSENYPDLKANQNFMQLQSELSDIENKIAASRRFFNSASKELNASILVFPASVIAPMMGFKAVSYFELGEERESASKPVEVKF